jgi:predicted ABC-type ATPase
MPDLYIIAGCNGAGKTTACYTVLPEMLHCKEFVNGDNIATGISPFNPEKVAIDAGRIMLHRIHELINQKESFAFETTLASKGFVSLIKQAKTTGFKITLIYFWLDSIETAKLRVKERVKKGGHDVPQETIVRRYKRGIVNFLLLYKALCDFWLFVDNSLSDLKVVADGEKGVVKEIKNPEIWDIILKQANAFKA